MPRDGFGREIDYLRISLIDHCNLRCVYCMPLEAAGVAPAPDWLTADEIGLVARAARLAGFRKIRLTGGEPTLRPDLVTIVAAVAASGIADIALTTNGIRLTELAGALAGAGLRRVNVHLDTLDPVRLPLVMRGGRLDAIWRGILAAEAAGLLPIKLNAVVVRGFNEEDVVALARLTLERPWHVRFIESMPLGVGEPARVARTAYVSNAETRARIEASLGALEPLAASDPSDEARNFRAPGACGVIGFVSPVSEPYCGTCNRMRLTADGRFHLCLLNDDELDVGGTIRAGGGPDEVAAILVRAVAAKPPGHQLHLGTGPREREMYQLGG
ncbi:MAG TPA: GTP 3',8-cyclase MoaA [Candidatus Limnocylindria bacterium]|nr:GTP 3',8-cyclase MoaA [Candidatus Limnocylindria bacterium]